MALFGAGCLGTPIDTAVDPSADDAISAAAWQRVYVFDGERTAAEGASLFPFQVPEGAAEVEALLTWRQPGAHLAFRLLDPDGNEAARGWNEAEGRAYVTTTQPVVPGEWSLEISSARSIAAPYAATVRVHSEALPYGPIETTFVVPPRNPTRDVPSEARALLPPVVPRDFAEVNLNMRPGDGFRFAWEATGEVYFNVHYHGADGTERPIEHRGDALEGEFSANATQVYALLWRNEGTSEVEVRLEMDGTYRLHSMTRRA